MDTPIDQCDRLRKLHAHLTEEVRVLRASTQQAEREGADTSSETLNTIKSLQASLSTISQALAKCPPEAGTTAPATLQEEARSLPASRRLRYWTNNDPDSKPVEDDTEDLLDTEQR